MDKELMHQLASLMLTPKQREQVEHYAAVISNHAKHLSPEQFSQVMKYASGISRGNEAPASKSRPRSGTQIRKVG